MRWRWKHIWPGLLVVAAIWLANDVLSRLAGTFCLVMLVWAQHLVDDLLDDTDGLLRDLRKR